MMEHLGGVEKGLCGHYQVRMRDVEERLEREVTKMYIQNTFTRQMDHNMSPHNHFVS